MNVYQYHLSGHSWLIDRLSSLLEGNAQGEINGLFCKHSKVILPTASRIQLRIAVKFPLHSDSLSPQVGSVSGVGLFMSDKLYGRKKSSPLLKFPQDCNFKYSVRKLISVCEIEIWGWD
jgi:hypothetical protein